MKITHNRKKYGLRLLHEIAQNSFLSFIQSLTVYAYTFCEMYSYSKIYEYRQTVLGSPLVFILFLCVQ